MPFYSQEIRVIETFFGNDNKRVSQTSFIVLN